MNSVRAPADHTTGGSQYLAGTRLLRNQRFLKHAFKMSVRDISYFTTSKQYCVRFGSQAGQKAQLLGAMAALRCSSRGLRFSSQHPHGISHVACNSSSEDPLLASMGTRDKLPHTHPPHTHIKQTRDVILLGLRVF